MGGRGKMNSVDLMSHTLSALLDSQKPKQSNQPNAVVRVEVTLEIDVPCWKSLDENGPDVTIDEPSTWKISQVDEKLRAYVETAVEEIVMDEWRDLEEAAAEAHENRRDGYGDWLLDQRKDRES
jgi:hypothetical protein